MRITIATVAILALAGCEYSAPLSGDFETPLNVLAGTVAADQVDDPTHTILFITDSSNPGPPEGTGGPETFTTVPGSHFTDPDAAGLSGAPWSLTSVPDGDWLVTGFMDQDNDFYISTTLSALAGATCGDVLGAHVVDVETQEIAVVHTEGGELVDDITVALAARLTTERPAFTLENEAIDASPGNGPAVSIAVALEGGAIPQQFKLSATAVHSDLSVDPIYGQLEQPDNDERYPPFEYHLDGPFNPLEPAACQTGFLGRLVDANLDGVPDELPGFEGLGLYDMWPRVYLSYAGDEAAEGETWAAQAAISPFMYGVYDGTRWPNGAPQGFDDDGDGTVDEAFDIPLNSQIYLPELSVTWLPGALRTAADGTSETVTNPNDIPRGAWEISVITEAGQTWTIPNDLARFPSLDDSFVAEKQGAMLIVQD
ncbi:MAG: hypothetical protein KC912_07975 [Proteobacteria bacterium]|nr:hypothetical protein [Pseudomonadota bacterium]